MLIGPKTEIDKSRKFHFLPAAVAIVGFVILLLHRNPTLFTDPQLWAEDMFVYFSEDRLFGSKAILEPYSGYVQLGCRLIAWISGMAPVEFIPRLYATAFIGVIILAAVLTYTSNAFSRWGKTAATLALIAGPFTSEVFTGMLYTQWVLAPVVALALYERPTSIGRSGMLAACFAIVGLSSPFTIVASPLVVLKTIWDRSVFAATLALITLGTALFHLHDLIQRFRAGGPKGSTLERAATSTTVLYRWLVGDHYPGQTAAVLISMVAVIAALSYLWINRRLAARPFVFFLSYGIALLIVGCLALDPAANAHQLGPGSRYFYIPVVLILWTFIAIEQHTDRTRYSFPAFAVVIGLLYVTHVSSAAIHFRDTGWPATVQCLKHDDRVCSEPLQPAFLGTILLPSDAMLSRMSPTDRRQFKSRIDP